MASLHTEIGIMVAILVGAWLVKVFAVAVYMMLNRRRLLQQAATGRGSACPLTGKPTPQHIIQALPVLPYAKVAETLKQHEACEDKSGRGTAGGGAQPAVEKGAASTAAAVAGSTGAAAPVVSAGDPEQQQQQQQQEEEDIVAQSDKCSSQQHMQAAGLAAGSQQPSTVALTGEQQQLLQLQQSADTDCCAICFTEYEPSTEVRQLPCGHYYHPECIDSWLERDTTCPLCKSTVWNPAIEECGNSSAPAAAGVGGSNAQQRRGLVATLPDWLQVAVTGDPHAGSRDGHEQQQQQQAGQQAGRRVFVATLPDWLQIVVIGDPHAGTGAGHNQEAGQQAGVQQQQQR